MNQNDWLEKARAEGRIKEHGVNVAALTSSETKRPSILLDQMSEKEFQTEVCRLAHAHGWRIAHFRPVRVQRADGSVYYETPVAKDGTGFPDLLMVRKGCRPVYAELKVKTNTPSAQQWEWIHALREAGAIAKVWYPSDWQDVVETLTIFGCPSEASALAQELHRLADDGNPNHAGQEAA